MGGHGKKLLFVAIIIIVALGVKPELSKAASYSLTILHTNDSHSHVEMYPQLTTAVKQQRASDPNALLLDDGDVFDGTAYFDKYKGQASLWFMNNLKYDAMTFGNHEFSQTATILSNFIKGTTFPLISSNVNVTSNAVLGPLYQGGISTSPQGGKIYPSIIKTVNGEKIGIFGLLGTTSTTAGSTPVQNIVLENYTTKANQTVAALKQQGVNKIIVLSHLGYDTDVKLAKAVSGIDVIVGGHTHTKLTSPIQYVNPSGEPTIVVQTGAYLNYLGYVKVTFNSSGVVTAKSGKLLDLKTYAADPTAKAKVNEYDGKAPVQTVAAPVVNGVTDQSTAVAGTAVAGSTVTVKTNGSSIGSGKAGTDGKFSVTIPAQKAGSTLSVTATNSTGTVSAATTVTVQATVVQDTTAPAKPVVNNVTDQSTSVSGTAEASSKVDVKVNGSVIGSAPAGTDGKFTVTIPVQKAGTALSVTATDKASNVSSATSVVVQASVVKDTTAPAAPTVNTVYKSSTSVIGNAEAVSTITVTIGSKKYTGKAGLKGNFYVSIPKQKSGTQLKVTATDAAGNVSAAKTVTVK